MHQIKTLNKISPVGLSQLNADAYTVGDNVKDEEGILVRSAEMKSYAFPGSLLAIARAGAGTNNIPVSKCTEAGIVVFNTPGANANAVKELAVCAMLVASRDVVGGAEWVRAQAEAGADVPDVVEKGKSAFTGPELMGKSLGIIGLGAVGVQVANISTKLGMTVYGYDPFLSVDSALSLSRAVHRVLDLSVIYRTCDYISLHLPLADSTRGTLNADAFSQMKTGVRIINLARGELVNDDDLIPALDMGKVACYVTDFPNNKITLMKNVVAIPHLGASSPESEDNCAFMAAEQLREYLENGNIKNSVNLPALDQEWNTKTRLAIIHRNIPNMLASFTKILSQDSVNVETLSNKSRGEYAYTLLDVNAEIGDSVADEIRAVSGILRVRVLRR
ncbi:D-3-phosphoglycerate dehydrogenase [bioreactor metagenome]|uniref:phosphoglycerate dehydrogenase n=1 Tax=bioreactor metagenome TaxID=1076179 RepID=A0A644XLA7_9ZZZZ